MRRILSCLLLASIAASAPAAAQSVLAQSLSAEQRAQAQACLDAAGDDAVAARACIERAGSDDAPPAPAPVVAADAPGAMPIETQEVDPVDGNAAIDPAIPLVTGVSATGDLAAPDATAAPDAGDQPTQAEQDFAAIYGGETYDPIADPTLPAPALQPVAFDPWEKWNRKVHRFNNGVDRVIAKPLAKAYVAAVPRPVRLGVSNFFNNLGQPVSAVNALLQGKPKQAAQSLGRFVLNSTVGVAGLFDPATRAKLPNRSEDFGQTLGVWGWKNSRYVELPLFGPRTVRDAFGMVGDAPLSPLRQVENDRARVFLQGLQLVDVRTQLMAVDSLREGAADDYALVRDSWVQRRNYQIDSDRRGNTDDATLPDYLREDDNPTVPADAMPIIPGVPTN